MRDGKSIGVIIPALNEQTAIAKVIGDIPDWVDHIVVVDNGSSDDTAGVARRAGADVVIERRRGYGAACLAGLARVRPVDVVVFVDGDYSDYPDDMDELVNPIIAGDVDMVIGSRTLGQAEPGALSPQQRYGNWLATRLIRWIWGVNFSDLGPFRAIRWAALAGLEMADRDFGWTVEMQVKAAERGLRVLEVPVRYRRRVGSSKISGTVKGTLLAGTKILSIIAWRALRSVKIFGLSGRVH